MIHRIMHDKTHTVTHDICIILEQLVLLWDRQSYDIIRDR
jgi:hypothetical protein